MPGWRRVLRGAMLTVDGAAGESIGHGVLDVHDLIRDTASDLGLGLVRLQVDHRRIEDVFAESPDARDDVGIDAPTHDAEGVRDV